MHSEEHSLPHTHSGPLTPGQAGMLSFLLTEVAFFGTLIMSYVYFLRQTTESTPNPSEVFSLPLVLFSSLCLFSSSGTIHMAEKSLHGGKRQAFLGWLAATILLGLTFLGCTAKEWFDLIYRDGLTISRNMFGTTYFTLVGFHATHVTIGIIVMTLFLSLGLRGHITEKNPEGVQLTSWYWHFVDGVWVVVFLLVYIIGR